MSEAPCPDGALCEMLASATARPKLRSGAASAPLPPKSNQNGADPSDVRSRGHVDTGSCVARREGCAGGVRSQSAARRWCRARVQAAGGGRRPRERAAGAEHDGRGRRAVEGARDADERGRRRGDAHHERAHRVGGGARTHLNKLFKFARTSSGQRSRRASGRLRSAPPAWLQPALVARAGLRRGQQLPVRAALLGLAAGAHTTPGPHDKERAGWLHRGCERKCSSDSARRL